MKGIVGAVVSGIVIFGIIIGLFACTEKINLEMIGMAMMK